MTMTISAAPPIVPPTMADTDALVVVDALDGDGTAEDDVTGWPVSVRSEDDLAVDESPVDVPLISSNVSCEVLGGTSEVVEGVVDEVVEVWLAGAGVVDISVVDG